MCAIEPTVVLSAKPSEPWIVTIPGPVRRHPIAPTRIARPVRVFPAVSRTHKPTLSKVVLPAPDLGLVLGLGLVRDRRRGRVRVPDLVRAPTVRRRRRTVPRRVRKTTTMHRRDRIRLLSGVRRIRVIQCRRNHPGAAVAPRTVGTIGHGRVRRNRTDRTLLRNAIVICRHGTPVLQILAKS